MPDKRKILIVDDDNFLLNMYAMKFQKENFEVFTANDGSSALQKVEEGLAPDAVLLDIIMPTMDGLKFLETVRAKKLIPQAIVVILTNQTESADIDRAKELGIDGYIVKATTIPSEVLNEVMKILKVRKG
ncbi:MAG TPA: response regulator [Candidatus Paceibacterota bacterium]|nr:response regulator [Candidatus Paceibacterota bacterium]